MGWWARGARADRRIMQALAVYRRPVLPAAVDYLLLAFLMFNDTFTTEFANLYLERCHRDALLRAFPITEKVGGGR